MSYYLGVFSLPDLTLGKYEKPCNFKLILSTSLRAYIVVGRSVFSRQSFNAIILIESLYVFHGKDLKVNATTSFFLMEIFMIPHNRISSTFSMPGTVWDDVKFEVHHCSVMWDFYLVLTFENIMWTMFAQNYFQIKLFSDQILGYSRNPCCHFHGLV